MLLWLREGGEGRAREWHAHVAVSRPCGFLRLALRPWMRASSSVTASWPRPSDGQSVLTGWESVWPSAEPRCSSQLLRYVLHRDRQVTA